MSIIRANIIASFSIPVLVFLVFIVAGLTIFGVKSFEGVKYSSGWLGIVYAGGTYAYISVLISTIPTIVLGMPITLLAKKFGYLNKRIVLLGAIIIGGLFLSIVAGIFGKTYNIQIILLAMLAGGIGGLLNGYVFLRLANLGE